MIALPAWLPSLIELDQFGGDWDAYVNAVYARFVEDFVSRKATYRGCRVGVRYHPPTRGKGF